MLLQSIASCINGLKSGIDAVQAVVKKQGTRVTEAENRIAVLEDKDLGRELAARALRLRIEQVRRATETDMSRCVSRESEEVKANLQTCITEPTQIEADRQSNSLNYRKRRLYETNVKRYERVKDWSHTEDR
ncbi:hypothetical protein ATANTOWER_023878 [Ataeniobius toweri]|uniref:Uncharacterized protein n=1 Tax=Ataeniobius toweri TaxID=208326 RepID=A0ABU7AHL2_9TELE|nr:hypothetical protein [Ataeniobius toweri]